MVYSTDSDSNIVLTFVFPVISTQAIKEIYELLSIRLYHTNPISPYYKNRKYFMRPMRLNQSLIYPKHFHQRKT